MTRCVNVSRNFRTTSWLSASALQPTSKFKEKQHWVEDSLSATQAPGEQGIVPGGGTALVQAEHVLEALGFVDDAAIGASIVRKALSEPLRWIANNGLRRGRRRRERKTLPRGRGFNALTGGYGDLIAAGVIDPAKVTRSALQSAASVAALLLTTVALVAEDVLGAPGAVWAPGFGDLAERLSRPSSLVQKSTLFLLWKEAPFRSCGRDCLFIARTGLERAKADASDSRGCGRFRYREGERLTGDIAPA